MTFFNYDVTIKKKEDKMRYIVILLTLWGVTLNANLTTITDDTSTLVELAPLGSEPAMFGTNIVPLNSTDVELRKVRLRLKGRSHSKYVKVTTDYILLNPSDAQKVMVEFDAGRAKSKEAKLSPHLLSITFKVNGNYIHHTEHKVSLKDKDLRHLYLFELALKKDKNHVMFEYVYRVETPSRFYYQFEHDLEGFSKWANKKLDLFILDLDIGTFQSFRLQKGFFKEKSELKCNGKIIDNPKNHYVTVYLKKGKLYFRKKDFYTDKRFRIESSDSSEGRGFHDKIFDSKEDKLSLRLNETPLAFKGWKSDHILRALPYARRGFVFKCSKGVQEYFKSLEWYTPNRTLKRSDIKLTGYEKNILDKMIPEPLYNEKLNEWERVGDK